VWFLGALFLAIFFFFLQRFDARVRPDQPSGESMRSVLDEIAIPPNHKRIGGLQAEAKDGRIIYTEKFSVMESMNEVAMYYTDLMRKEGWYVIYANQKLSSYNMKLCKGRISFFIWISGLEQSSTYSLRAAWAYHRGSFAYCGS
jgi:hypothetical protein